MNIILFGFKKCGKTYYGLRLAQKLHMEFIDLDHLIEEYYRKQHHSDLSYREIAKKHGFAYFRDLEKHIITTLHQAKNSVISLGGGAVLDPKNVERLKEIGLMIYLKVDKEILKRRILSQEPPAYFNHAHPIESFEKMYKERLPIYEQVSPHHVDAGHPLEEVVLERIMQIIHMLKDQKHGKQ